VSERFSDHLNNRSLNEEWRGQLLIEKAYQDEEAEAEIRPDSPTIARRVCSPFARRESFALAFVAFVVMGAIAFAVYAQIRINQARAEQLDAIERKVNENARFVQNALTVRGGLLDRLTRLENRTDRFESTTYGKPGQLPGLLHDPAFRFPEGNR